MGAASTWSCHQCGGVLQPPRRAPSFGKGLCNLGIHKVDCWTYRHSRACIQDGVCQRCGAKRDRVYHDWVEGLFRVDCGRCHGHDHHGHLSESARGRSLMVGTFGKGLCDLGIHKVDWTYRHSKRCIQDGVCQRCGAKRDRVYHAPEDWVEGWISSDCGRCGEHFGW